jgi:secondary thiamine-phosphate synthase enzyme
LYWLIQKRMTYQKILKLRPYERGFHLITDQVTGGFPELAKIRHGLLHVFIKHTSAALSINENADPTVRRDFETFVNDLVPESYPKFIHTYEGDDDMPAHIKSSLIGSSIQIPITDGRLNLGTWQGIYLCEFRNQATSRTLVLTAIGD